MKKLTILASIDSIDTVTDFVNEALEAAECSVKAQLQIDVAIDEVLSNIAKFAYGEEEGDVTVGIEVQAASRVAVITFADSGTPYNPLLAKEPDTSLSADEREIGGLGIYLLRKSMDALQYEYKNGQNILMLMKKI